MKGVGYINKGKVKSVGKAAVFFLCLLECYLIYIYG